jgi:hypothetical protein
MQVRNASGVLILEFRPEIGYQGAYSFEIDVNGGSVTAIDDLITHSERFDKIHYGLNLKDISMWRLANLY